MSRPASLTVAEARRTALRAQGLDRPRPSGPVGIRHLRRVARDLGLIQLDSVNVLARAHLMPFFSRLGPFDPALLDRLAYEDNELYEYWGHVASLIDVRFEPHLRWRGARGHDWSSPEAVAAERPALIEQLADAVATDGPLSAGELDDRFGDGGPRASPWWGWGDTKKAVEHLFWTGRVRALRRGNFERVYCAPDRAVPRRIIEAPTPGEADAKRTLLEHAVRLHGVGTAADLADVWRLRVPETRTLLEAMVADGQIEAVEVEGWRGPAYRHPSAVVPRRVDACALVSPFDPAMWHRDRVARVHAFDYRIEIYVPAAKRRYGYYCLPFLLGDTFVARVDLKADRANGRLLVQSAHPEADLSSRGTDAPTVADRLATELHRVRIWLGLDDIVVRSSGGLAALLRTAVRRGGP